MERFVDLGKNAVALLRDSALLLLAALLLLFPARFNDMLVSAGFEEGSFVGFKWKAKLVEADDALKAAQATIGDLEAQLEKTTRALVDAHAHAGDDAARSAVRRLDDENRRLKASSAQVEASLRSTIASNAPMVEKARAAVSSSGGWGVVLGSDVSLEAARDQIGLASRQGISGATVYLRNGYYASISVVDDRATAQEYLKIAKGFRPDAYITSMTTWCGRPLQREGYVECQGRP